MRSLEEVFSAHSREIVHSSSSFETPRQLPDLIDLSTPPREDDKKMIIDGQRQSHGVEKTEKKIVSDRLDLPPGLLFPNVDIVYKKNIDNMVYISPPSDPPLSPSTSENESSEADDDKIKTMKKVGKKKEAKGYGS